MTNSKSLRTISIGFPFQTATVVIEPNFSTNRALFDFDVVVVRPYSLVGTAISGGGGGQFSVEWRDYSGFKDEMTRKIEDIHRLLAEGGLLIVVLDALEIIKCRTGGYTGGTIYTVTNYDFLDSHFFESVRNGAGDRVSCESSNPFSKVIKASSVYWTAFIAEGVPYPFSPAKVFAVNGKSSVVGASVEVKAGHIIFLPNFKHLDEASFFEACLDYRTRREGTPPPDWVSSIYLAGQAAIEKEISSVSAEIKRLKDAREERMNALNDLLGYKKLLFEKGKTQLEPIVVKAMNLLGFQASPGEYIPGTKFEIDGRTKAGKPGILEIKGSKNQIGLDELGSFPTKILEDFKVAKSQSKGILVGNGLCLERPQKRLGNSVFTTHALDAAKTNSVAFVNSVELYGVVCGVLDGQKVDLKGVRETILTANGYADLTKFVPPSIFP